MKTKPKPRARRMWANYYPENPQRPVLHYSRKNAERCVAFGVTHAAVPVAVIPLHDPYALGDAMVSALTAIGLLPKPKKGRK